ncbi:hypothetical protein GCM10009654_19270 [Streptomyces hebeiensis]|uniref:Histidine kinase/HSP90-like ATPase domain-containing protein n=1 Tax=Streptomyces hebeiensis TaxID=229486 RepID=A0ABN1UQW3_9ACTN
MLRADPDRPDPPRPSLDRVPELVDDARMSGSDATLTSTVAGTPSDALGRTCYRVVQEGLTNAAEHAQGADVRVGCPALRRCPGPIAPPGLRSLPA